MVAKPKMESPLPSYKSAFRLADDYGLIALGNCALTKLRVVAQFDLQTEPLPNLGPMLS